MIRALTLLICLCAAPMARAHPHVFVDVGLSFETDAEGRLVAVEVQWSYDDLFSLLVLSDRGLDMDGDMILTEAERAALIGFDLVDWPPDFEGALFLYQGDAKLALAAPEALSLELRQGRIVTRHRRPLKAPAPLTALDVQPYDPSYYAALTLREMPGMPAGCTGEILRPDTEAADAKLEKLGGLNNEGLFEEVQVGIYYADTLVVTCGSS